MSNQLSTTTTSTLQMQNKHERDKRIVFDEGPHIYYIDGCCKGYISSTTIIHSFVEPFDADNVISKIRKSRSTKYSKMTDEEIKESWEKNRVESALAGTNMHKNIELVYNNIEVDDDSVEFAMFQEFLHDHSHLEAFRTEWEIFCEDHKIAGSIDMLFKQCDGGFIICDWKRSKEIKTQNKFQKMKYPLEHLDDCNFNLYSLQLNLYKWILENKYKINIVDMFLVVLHPNNKKYKKIKVDCKKDEINLILDERKRQLKVISEQNKLVK